MKEKNSVVLLRSKLPKIAHCELEVRPEKLLLDPPLICDPLTVERFSHVSPYQEDSGY